ncbi:hypothetical protein [uncultured Porphyromonas sp.]|nr:hypothetical protein [uncultured Porphyromonas sp.]
MKRLLLSLLMLLTSLSALAGDRLEVGVFAGQQSTARSKPV